MQIDAQCKFKQVLQEIEIDLIKQLKEENKNIEAQIIAIDEVFKTLDNQEKMSEMETKFEKEI